jgi:hypothetical protein
LVVERHAVTTRSIREAGRLTCVLVFAALVLALAARDRGMEYDESYSLLLTTGHARPDWPTEPERADQLQTVFAGTSSLASIARDLQAGDVHPPLYFWLLELWQRAFGNDRETSRALSIVCALAALSLTGAIARLTAIPPASAIMLTLGCYGFAYTGHIARGFALALTLDLAGVFLVLLAVRGRRVAWAILAGLAFGAASLTNYLACFVAIATILWLLARSAKLFLGAALAGAIAIPGGLCFFLAQRNSRIEQFPPFELLASLTRLARYAAGSVVGALPLYVPGITSLLAAAGLGAILLGLGALVVARWPLIAARGHTSLLALCAIATPLGLLALGAVFNTTPIEVRYFALATPFIGLLLAGTFASLARWGQWLQSGVFTVQALSVLGLITAAESRQPQRETAREAAAEAGMAGLVMVPFGNDGVGVAGPFVAESPDAARILVVRDAEQGRSVAASPRDLRRIVIARLGVDRASRALLPSLEAAIAETPCWERNTDTVRIVSFERRC